MARTAPALAVVLATMLAVAPMAEAKPCKTKRACKAQTLKKPKKPTKPRTPPPGTGWIDGIYNGGPGDPIIAPIP